MEGICELAQKLLRDVRLSCGLFLILCWPDKPELRLNLVSERHFTSAIRLENSDCDAQFGFGM